MIRNLYQILALGGQYPPECQSNLANQATFSKQKHSDSEGSTSSGISNRHGRASTIVVSQLPVTKWFETIGDSTIADAILDRLVHTAHRIELKGESMRKKQ